VRRSAIASLLVFTALAPRALADEDLTINLPASQATAGATTHAAPAADPAVKAQQAAQQQRAKQFQEYSRRRAVNKAAATTKPFGSRGAKSTGGTKQFTVGRLGVANKAAPIRAARSSSRTMLSKVQPGTYLALNCENGDWYGVLMADRTTGWVKKSDVKMLDYEVVSDRPQDAAAYTASQSPTINTGTLGAGQQTILEVAQGFLGVPYKWGGTSPNGMDCSAFVQRCFAAAGYRLPRTAREQINWGVPVSSDQLQAADRVYFANSKGEITHTGIYMGGGYFIHASGSHKQVTVSRLTESLYTRMYAGARR
jgi:cell wall-associated NlpC family hydrolase